MVLFMLRHRQCNPMCVIRWQSSWSPGFSYHNCHKQNEHNVRKKCICTHRKLEEGSHAGKQLQYKGLPMQNVKLATGIFNGLAELGVAFIVRVHLVGQKTPPK